ncbi:MAG: HlyD family efflux transporter periplasmic adaptor subunit [Bacteroidales bacterium]|nr:HlyD family efflux transporter periplasmic adaptor subunit [Bacteroidales bacterium]
MTDDILNLEEHHLTKESFLASNTVRGTSVYLATVLIIVLTVVLLPIIKVSISIQGRGIIRPLSEKTEIKALYPELVTSIYVQEGQFINKGDTMLTLSQDIFHSKLVFLQNELEKVQFFVNDLQKLTGSKNQYPVSGLYQVQFNSFRQKVDGLDHKIEKANKEIERYVNLYEKEIIPAKEYDDLVFNLKQLEKEKSILKTAQVAQWKAELVEYSTKKRELEKQIEEIINQERFYTVTSPVSGSIEEFSGIYVGSILQAGQAIAVISPESEKIAEVYVAAKDIGYIHEGQTAKIQVDAFNYNQWGTIEATILDISDDYIVVDNMPVFNIKCRLVKDYLVLKNGVKGNIMKGMTVNARFMISKRSLFQMLYQKSDDWLNPVRRLVSEKF